MRQGSATPPTTSCPGSSSPGPDLSTQRRLAGQIEALLLEETPIIYPYFYDYLSASQKNVTGVYPLAMGAVFLWNASKS